MRTPSIALVGAACLGIAACSNQYIERKDTVTLGAGDAVASNIAVLTHDPWPVASRDNRIPMDGVKAEKALARYRSGNNGGAANGGYGAPPAPGILPPAVQ